MKNVLILFGVKPKNLTERNWESFSSLIKENLDNEHIKLTTSALSKLTYYVNGEESKVFIRETNKDIAEFDLVVFVYTGTKREYAIAAARYLEFKNIPFIDRYLKRAVPSGKLACAMQRSLKEVDIVPTLGATSGNGLLNSLKYFNKFNDFPLVLKADIGRKGQNNFLVKSKDDLREILSKNKDVNFVLQPYVENDGDYRFLVMGSEVRLAFKRSGDKSKTHLNNTSSGANVNKIDLEKVSKEVLSLVKRAAAVDRLSVAGVDLIEDKTTGRWMVLEVNISPQLITGEFAKEKTEAYAEMIRELLEKKSYKPNKTGLIDLEEAQKVGRREYIGIFESGEVIRAKVDSGAYYCSLHVGSVELKDSKLKVVFDNGVEREFDKFRKIEVSPTGGHREKRFVVPLEILMGDKIIKEEISLSSRTGLRNKFLLGRRILKHGNYLIDSSRSFYFGKDKEEIKIKLKERSK
ncbi:MAG: ATP-dependent zinc protease [Candidatus Nomurabacteria bacterium]|nr:MAG: ATP-dependent zinc protease [Candidatus Nomurabacteria bacterium]HRV76283.1 RimK/LysX family protein [Candidatus Saccharimonadales bacterium]